MRIHFRGGMGDELALTAVIRELKRQIPLEMVTVDTTKKWIYENNPWINHGQIRGQKKTPLIHWHEKLGNIAHSFAKQLGLHSLEDDTPEIFLTPKEIDDMAVDARQFERPIVCIDTRAAWYSRIWPHKRFEELAKLLGEQATIVEVGHELEVNQGARDTSRLEAAHFSCVNDMSPRQTAALLAHADLFVGNDSGGFHLAAAVGCPQVVIFGPKKWYARSYWTTTPVFSYDECPQICERTAWCHRKEKEGGRFCLEEIPMSQVNAAVHTAFRRFGKWAPARLEKVRSTSLPDEACKPTQ